MVGMHACMQESLDGDLAVRVFMLVAAADTGYHCQRYDIRSRQRLDAALLAFFQHFRKVYVGDQVMQSSKVYARYRTCPLASTTYCQWSLSCILQG